MFKKDIKFNRFERMANEVRVQKRVALVLWAEDGVVYISPIQSDFAREGVDVDEGIV